MTAFKKYVNYMVRSEDSYRIMDYTKGGLL